MSSDCADDSGFCSSTATTVRRTRYHALGDVHCFTRRLLGASRRFAIVGHDGMEQCEELGGGRGRVRWLGKGGRRGCLGRGWRECLGRGWRELLTGRGNRVGEMVTEFAVEGVWGGNVGNV